MRYIEIRNEQPVMRECFYAFSNSQMKEGIENTGIEGKKIYSGGNGLYGTKEGIKELFGYYDNQRTRIKEECDPQQVYNYEYDNHECGWLHDDTEAIKIIVLYFGEERAKEVKRRNGYADIDSLFKKKTYEAI